MVDKVIDKNVKVISTTQASRIYGKDRSTIKRWCEKGQLVAAKDPGGNWTIYIEASEYERLLKLSIKFT